jgi:CCR4-NOT transcriptional regulation complex NOT5 subunit
VVDAGEAGIGGNNIVIAANAVIGASNIDVGGSSVGVPTTTVAVPVGAAGAAAAAASAAQTAQQSVAANNDKTQASQSTTGKAPVLNSLEVDVIGFGDCSVSDVKEGKTGCG